MRRLVLLLSAVAWASGPEGTLFRVVTGDMRRVPEWSGNHLVEFDCQEDGIAYCVAVHDAAARRRFRVDIREFAVNPNPRLDAVAVAPDGTTVLGIGRKFQFDGYLVVLDPSGRLRHKFSTGLYQPEQVAFGADGSIWTFGSQGGEFRRDEEAKEDYATIRRYSAKGASLGAWAPRSVFPGVFTPAQLTGWRQLGEPFIAALRDSVVVWSEAAGVLVELKADGSGLTRVEVPGLAGRHAQCSNAFAEGKGFFALCAAGPEPRRLYRLSGGAWQPVEGEPPAGVLIGSDAGELVTAQWLPAGYRVRRHRP